MDFAFARRAFAGLAIAACSAAALAFGEAIVERSGPGLLAQPPEVAVRTLVWERTHCRDC